MRGTRRLDTLASPLLDLLDVRYVLAEPSVAGRELPSLTLAHRSDLAVFENPNWVPRAFLVDELRVLTSPSAVLDAMKQPSFRPDLWAYSEVPIAGLAGTGTAGAPAEAGTARVAQPGNERVRVEVQPVRPALLVLGDTFYPGWKAWVDGVEQPIHRVDYVLRGVVVKPGDREVVFEYRPLSFRIGAIVSLAALAAVAVISLRLRRPRGIARGNA
jgi:hypothetical protein